MRACIFILTPATLEAQRPQRKTFLPGFFEGENQKDFGLISGCKLKQV